MKREVLFRGKRIDNGEWVFGCLVYQLDATKKEDEYKYTFIKEPFGMIGNAYEVDPSTVGQFINRLDRNSNIIFEGQKVKVFTDKLSPEYDLEKEIIICEVFEEDGGFHLINVEMEFQIPIWQISGSEGLELLTPKT